MKVILTLWNDMIKTYEADGVEEDFPAPQILRPQRREAHCRLLAEACLFLGAGGGVIHNAYDPIKPIGQGSNYNFFLMTKIRKCPNHSFSGYLPSKCLKML